MYPFPLFRLLCHFNLFWYYITVFSKRKAQVGNICTFSVFSKKQRFSGRGIVFVTDIPAAFPHFLNTMIFYQTFFCFAMYRPCFFYEKVVFFSRIICWNEETP